MFYLSRSIRFWCWWSVSRLRCERSVSAVKMNTCATDFSTNSDVISSVLFYSNLIQPSNSPNLISWEGQWSREKLISAAHWVLLKTELMDYFLPSDGCKDAEPTLRRRPAATAVSPVYTHVLLCVLSPVLSGWGQEAHVVFCVHLSGPLTSPSGRIRSSI